MGMKALPDSFLRCLSPAERKKIGQRTAAEVLANGEAKSEKELQRMIVQLLRLKGIEPIVSRMDRRTSNNVGTPDIIFAITEYWWTKAHGWEIKLPQGKLSPEQEAMHKKLMTRPNAWSVKVIRSVQEAIEELRSMGIQ